MFASKSKHVDKQLLLVVGLLVVSGFFIFISASLGLLTRGSLMFKSSAINQLIFGLGLGTVAMVVLSKIHYRVWKRLAMPLFVFAVLFTLSVFIPGLGYSSGGATRWVHMFGISIQPAEILKVASILFAASYLSQKYKLLTKGWYGLLVVFGLLGLPAIVLLLQPDTGTVVVIAAAIVSMYFTVGARWRDIGVLIVAGVVAIGVLANFRPYVLSRLMTFMHPWEAQQTSGYQIKQSLLAVGSGGFVGRGFGQSVQKFNYLPEPTSDSIYAVLSEEFGFVGAVAILILFMWFAQRSLRIASKAPDYFGALTVIGLSLLIVYQAILNIAAMLAIAPLTGLPLPFISHGGTAMAVTLASVGIILSVSRYVKV